MVVLDDHKATMSPGAVFLRKSPGAVTAADDGVVNAEEGEIVLGGV
jgi:hypothetical protein